MYIEMRTYTLHCGKTREYLEHYQAEGVDLHARITGNLIGVFTTEIGELDQITFMNGYEDLKQRCDRRDELYKNHDWLKYAAKVRPMIARQESRILVPASCSPLR